MKYILKNIKLFITKEKFMYSLTFATIFVSVLMLHFSYGLYQSYMSEKEAVSADQSFITISMNYDIEQEEVNSTTGAYRLKDDKKKDEVVTMDMFCQLVNQLSEQFQEDLINVGLKAEVDHYPLYFNFDIKDNKMVNSAFFEENMKKNSLLSGGRFFTNEEYEKGLKTAIVFDTEGYEGDTYTDTYQAFDGNSLVINQEKYQVIGKQTLFADYPIIPITAVEKDAPLYQFVEFEFEHAVTSLQYNELEELVPICFGDLAKLEKLNLPDKDKLYMYNTMILVAVFIAVISAINFAILYRYILQTRKRELSIYRICGMSKRKAVGIYVFECILITLPAYLLAVILFRSVFLPEAKEFFYYMADSYAASVYAILFILYYGVSIVILLIMILYSLEEEKMRIGGGKE